MKYSDLPFELSVGVEQYMNAMLEDFAKWTAKWQTVPPYDIHPDEIVGSKYLRIWKGTSSHSFIVLKDFTVNCDPGAKNKTLDLKRGDILKCASWKKPALNFVRGNVLRGDWKNCRWTGAA